MPQLSLRDGLPIEIVEETKLLGVIITSDLKWKSNTKNIIRKAYKRMWIVKRLKSLGANLNQLKFTFVQPSISISEVAVPAWHPGLTVGEQINIESFCPIVLGNEYTIHQEALSALGLETLEN